MSIPEGKVLQKLELRVDGKATKEVVALVDKGASADLILENAKVAAACLCQIMAEKRLVGKAVFILDGAEQQSKGLNTIFHEAMYHAMEQSWQYEKDKSDFYGKVVEMNR